MKIFITFLMLVSILLGMVAAAIIPGTVERGLDKRGEYSPEVDSTIFREISYAFGSQVASTFTPSGVQQHCKSLEPLDKGKWEGIGLTLDKITTSICYFAKSEREDDFPTPAQWIASAFTQLYLRQLMRAFDVNGLLHLCKNLSREKLYSLGIDGYSIIYTTCYLAHDPYEPSVDASTTSLPIDRSIVAVRSKLYGVLRAANEDDDKQLQWLCKVAKKFYKQYAAVGLDGKVVKKTMCDIHQPLTTEETQKHIFDILTQMFLTTTVLASDTDGWLDWLCDNLLPDGMAQVGLHGSSVDTYVCPEAHRVAESD